MQIAKTTTKEKHCLHLVTRCIYEISLMQLMDGSNRLVLHVFLLGVM